jgi:adenine-specific DNA-methyltransferase
MARKAKAAGRGTRNGAGGDLPTADYRHTGATRKNAPPAALASEGEVPRVERVKYAYSPHLSPVLRFDSSGEADRLQELVAEAGRRPLTADEQRRLQEALRSHEPWLEWAGKRESDAVSEGRGWFEVDPVALHIHERISTQAILRAAAREDVQRDLFADPQQKYHEAVQFYRHDMDWTNRLILGDSLQVMSSLARREDLAGKVQMIYIDPPYGINYRSNFQPLVGRRDVKDKDVDLTREPEGVRAYRDAWCLGVHSYLAYLRDRLLVARELLAETGSIFVQIGDEHLQRVADLLDATFGARNAINVIVVKKKSSTPITESVADYILWYAKDANQASINTLRKLSGEVEDADKFRRLEFPNGERRALALCSEGDRERHREWILRDDYPVVSQDEGPRSIEIELQGKRVAPPKNGHWRYDPDAGMRRLERAERLRAGEGSAFGIVYWKDSSTGTLTNLWDDLHGEAAPVYVVQTNWRVLERCLLLTTKPGDLVIDPTCGSGTAAYVAELLGRRWITIDTSRVAVAIARQRLLTARFEYFELKDERAGVAGGFKCANVPRITLSAIAQNTNLDPILESHQATLDSQLDATNAALGRVTPGLREKLLLKLHLKQKEEGKRAITDADRRRWDLPRQWAHWEVPFDTDPDWPKPLQDAVAAYRQAWRAKMDEVNACIAANAEQEELVDQPEKLPGVVRVSGPFTVEAVRPAELSLDAGGFDGAPEELETGFAAGAGGGEAKNAVAYLQRMFRLLRQDGLRFLGNKQMEWSRLEPLFESGASDGIHAEGRWVQKGHEDEDPDGAATVGVMFGPQYGPVTAEMLEHVIKPAARKYDDLVVAGFSFDAPAHAVLEDGKHPRLRLHMAHIRPDVNPAMDGLLKEQPGSQLFTVFGQPSVKVRRKPGSREEWVVELEGVAIYDPVANTVTSAKADKVAAWFLDADYDGRTFCITQAFFPDRNAWAKLAKALGTVVGEEAFEAFAGTESLPFPAGKHGRVAVKVIDPRGNEVMTVRKLEH